ncbi:MAG: alkane 1-monooxygenase [Proteobacteria bacterium]|nr:alkane 1-monooxygenase [Pseudomonadota bacterium]
MGYFLPHVFAILTAFGVLSGGWLAWLGVLITFALHPMLDYAFKSIEPKFQDRPTQVLAEISLHSGVPVLLFLLVCTFQSTIFGSAQSALEVAGSLLSCGMMMGVVGINSAHELIHRESKWSRAEGIFLLSLVNFSYWRINHVEVHHRWVATLKDPATSRKGESLYRYWVRAYLGAWVKSFEFETQRVKAEKLSWVHHRFVHYAGIMVCWTVLIFSFFGSVGLLYWLTISGVAILMLQTVDYVEHYGLLRKELKEGVYEVVKPQHSWDSYHLWTNWTLFNLGFHSHHHQRSNLEFTGLTKKEDSQKMPYGYSLMFLLALWPKLWRRTMDERIPT